MQDAPSWSFVTRRSRRKMLPGHWNWFIRQSTLKIDKQTNWSWHNTCIFIGDANGISPTTLSLARAGTHFWLALSLSLSLPFFIINILWVWINFKTFRQLAHSNLTFRCHLSYLVWHISHSSCCQKLFVPSRSHSPSVSFALLGTFY